MPTINIKKKQKNVLPVTNNNTQSVPAKYVFVVNTFREEVGKC